MFTCRWRLLNFVHTYIDDLLLTNSGDWQDHLDKLELVLQRLQQAGLKVNADKSFFGRKECEYLGYWITRNGIRPLSKKVDAISHLKPPTTRKQLRRFLGIINYYRDMWWRRSETLAPLTRLTSKNVPFKWTAVEQKAFDDMKAIISKDVLLAYPNFNLPFDVHTDASDTQLGAVVSQEGRPIAFYSRKLTPAQRKYSTIEKELWLFVQRQST